MQFDNKEKFKENTLNFENALHPIICRQFLIYLFSLIKLP